MTDRIRLTITVTPDVHQVFTTMAEAAGTSLGRAMGDWLADTSEAAQLIASKMAEAKQAPKTVLREMQAMLLGAQQEIHDLQVAARKSGRGGLSGVADQPDRAGHPPSSNTGGKATHKGGGKNQ